MAGVKISALPAVPSAQLTDIYPVVQGGVTYQESITQLVTLLNSNLTYLPLAGGTMSGAINMGSHLINAVTDPVSAQDAATKNYVDTQVTNFSNVFVARLASTGALTVTYNNGTAGVGATLTNAGAMAAFALDGVNANLNDLVLIKNQASAFQNGYYKVTTVGSGAANWILTRATQYDMPGEILPGDLFIITAGNTLANTSWIQTATVNAIGTDSISFSAFTVALPITVANGGTGLTSLTAYTLLAGGTTSTGNVQQIAAGSSGQVLQSNGAAALATFSTATYPTTTTINQLLYSSSANTVVGLATGNSGVLITSAGGVPSISSTLPTAVQSNITQLGTQTQALNMGSNLINNVTDPVSSQDAATKNYVDNIATGGGAPVVAATTGALTVTYNNGSSGVGATLTNAGAQATFSIDGQSPTVGQRVLIKNQASTLQNGVYTVTNVGSGSTNWVLTRATDYDTVADINGTGLIPVNAGTANANTGWINTTLMVTVGTTAITFIQFGTSVPVSLANGGTGASLTASNGGIFYSTGSAGAILAGTATANQVLLSGSSTTPAWSTATYPATTTANQLLYSSATNTIAGLTSANGGVLVTSNAGVPSILAGSGTTGTILRATSGGTPAWSTATYPATTTINQILYSSAANTVSGLATANNAILATDGSGVPSLSSSIPSAVLGNVTKVTTQVFTTGTAATYTTPANVTHIRVRCWGGGGAGGGGANVNASAGGGGGGGAYCESLIASPSASYTYTVGAGGTPGSAGNNPGGNGGTTTFSAGTMSAGGGTGGAGSAGSATIALQGTASAGGTASGGNLTNQNGIPGDCGFVLVAGASWAGAGGCGASGAAGAKSNVSANTNGTSGFAPGGGGSGGASSGGGTFAGGAGGAGLIIVEEYYVG